MVRALLFKFFTCLIEWVFRRRGMAFYVFRGGLSLLALYAVGTVTGKFSYRDSERSLSFEGGTGDFIPSWAANLLLGLGLILTLVGFFWIAIDRYRAGRLEARRKVIIVELRGLHVTPDTPAMDADLGLPRVNRQHLLLDFRRSGVGAAVDPEAAIDLLLTMNPTINSWCAGHNRSDVSVAVGGLASVPLLFLTGMLLEDESSVVVYDWDRDAKEWVLPTGVDDRDEVGTLELDVEDFLPGAHEAVLAVSASYAVDTYAIGKTFGDCIPVAHLRARRALVGVHWSDEKQRKLIAAFRHAVQDLMAKKVRRLHLVLAAPASVCIQLGMTYDKRLMPELLVYQYERTSQPPYPWAIQMPTHGVVRPIVQTTSLKLVAEGG